MVLYGLRRRSLGTLRLCDCSAYYGTACGGGLLELSGCVTVRRITVRPAEEVFWNSPPVDLQTQVRIGDAALRLRSPFVVARSGSLH